LYNKIHRTIIVTIALQTEETCQIRMSTFIVGGIVLKIFFLGIRGMYV